MLEILWASLALSALAVSAAVVALLLAVRDNVRRNGRSLDALNRELPAMLGALRLACEDLEALLSWGGKLGRGLGRVGGLLKLFRDLSGALGRTQRASHPNSGEQP